MPDTALHPVPQDGKSNRHREQIYRYGDRGGEGETYGKSNMETYITIWRSGCTEETIGKQEAFLFRALKTPCVFWCWCSDRAHAERGGAVAGGGRGTPAAHSGEDGRGDRAAAGGGGGSEAAAPPRLRRSGHFARQISGRAEPEHLATVACAAASRAM